MSRYERRVIDISAFVCMRIHMRVCVLCKYVYYRRQQKICQFWLQNSFYIVGVRKFLFVTADAKKGKGFKIIIIYTIIGILLLYWYTRCDTFDLNNDCIPDTVNVLFPGILYAPDRIESWRFCFVRTSFYRITYILQFTYSQVRRISRGTRVLCRLS